MTDADLKHVCDLAAAVQTEAGGVVTILQEGGLDQRAAVIRWESHPVPTGRSGETYRFAMQFEVKPEHLGHVIETAKFVAKRISEAMGHVKV